MAGLGALRDAPGGGSAWTQRWAKAAAEAATVGESRAWMGAVRRGLAASRQASSAGRAIPLPVHSAADLAADDRVRTMALTSCLTSRRGRAL